MKKSNEFFSSISTKMMMLAIVLTFVLAATLVTVSLVLTSKILTDKAAEQMNLFCEERGDDVDTELLRIEDAVGSLARWTRSKFPDVQTITDNSDLRDSIVNDADELIHFMTEDNEFVLGAYIHYTLDITGATDREEGVYYIRDASGKFKIIPITQEDIENDPVAEYWYYQPISNKEALWTQPYYEYNVEDYVISYVEPIYIGDVPVAVIGVDISFTKLLEWVDSLEYHETGYMYLKAGDGSAHYHADDLEHDHMHSDEDDKIIENEELLNETKTGDKLIRYYFEGRDRAMAFMTLRNGMKFVLCDGYDNIYKERDHARVVMVSISVGIALVFALIAAYVSTRVTNPLRELTQAANEISEGDFDVVLPPENNSEIGELSRAFRIAVDNIRARRKEVEAVVRAQDRKIEKDAKTLKQQKDDLVVMKNLAYIDPLTNVKSKHAYEETVNYIDEKIKDGTAEFAVVMCDLNYLKHINDNLGHNAGDEAIKKAASMLCTAFPMSAVYRIGGDEFAIIPTGIEYVKIVEKKALLKKMISDQEKVSDNYLERISIAFGCAVFDRLNDESYQQVFERADQLMYEDKRQIHMRDGISTERLNG